MVGRVEGRVAFITGAARGQGRSHAIRLAEEGASIIAVDLCRDVASTSYDGATDEDLAETVRLVEAVGQTIVASRADVRDFDGLKAALDQGVAVFGRLDIVSVNAGIVAYRQALDYAESEWQDALDINLTGAWHTVKAAVPHIMAGRRGGSIVLTSSGLGLKAMANTAAYTSSKHGVIGLTKSLALELAPHSIRVNAICPGCVDTPMMQSLATWKLFVPESDEPTIDQFRERVRAANVLPIPWLDAVDISNALLFLASDEARFITGVALPVDAGNLLL
jgi:(+)-trans-carveol dehydrogenase